MDVLKFHPILKRRRWGGRRLGTVLNKPLGEAADYAESWEVVDHGEDQSLVADGSFSGWSLHRLLAEFPQDLCGTDHDYRQFPLLVKFLDAQDRLSVQVHPNDELARRFDPGENGKTEVWVILAAEPDSRLYCGLKAGVDGNTLRQSLAAERLEECLHQQPVRPGDCVFIPAGTVHAIGEGILLAEIQQSSDLTFRLDDWGRLGADGRPRTLHRQQALQCIDFHRGPVEPVIPRRLPAETCQSEELVRSAYFVLRRHAAGEPFRLQLDNRFHIVMLIQGAANFVSAERTIAAQLGETLLIPAAVEEVEIHPRGRLVLLDVFLPR